jgi:hypothetical protein
MLSARQSSCKHAFRIEERCFLCSPCCARCYTARTKHAVIIETVFSAWSVPRLYERYGKSLGAVEFRTVTEPREWAYNGVQRSTVIGSVGYSHRKSLVEEIRSQPVKT